MGDQERISASGGDDEQCTTPPQSFSLMKTTEAAVKLAPWRRRWPARMSWLVKAAAVAVAVLIAVVVLLSYASSGDNDEMPDSLFTTRAPANLTDDQLLDGLLTNEFSSQSCRSRYEFADYHKKKKPTHSKPSPYLISKLRQHEAIQKRCGPGTAPYSKALRRLHSSSSSGDAAADSGEECRYVVSISYRRGLGNRILAVVSAFLYAVLTSRALLVAPYDGDLADLFCEPFPSATWLLPDADRHRFPLRQRLSDLDSKSKDSLGTILRKNDNNNNNATSLTYVYLHLDGGADFHDKLFYCDDQQLGLLRHVPWLLMKTDSYIIPGLFLVPSFQHELDRLFPGDVDKDAVFHHLSRYLLHPTNPIWHAITTYHRANLAAAARLVGMQIRVYHKETPPVSRVVLDQILACARLAHIFPPPPNTSVLVTSLNPWYAERISAGGEGEYSSLAVHQPSHEGEQRMGDAEQDRRALAEMHLLSTCDALMDTGFSTFGYVAAGMAGARAWVMPRRPWWEKEAAAEVPDPPCAVAASPEPCFHSPSYYDCAARRDYGDIGKVLPYVRRCEDVSWGIKLVGGSSL
uniref:Fucosyltransferase n=1 Tax=Leersia perrieri TaxID=77586 RepID=A0A0D9VER3_9ORYZ